MSIRRTSILALVTGAVTLLAGTVVAKPESATKPAIPTTKPAPKPRLDPTVKKQLTPRPLKSDELAQAHKQIAAAVAPPPAFALKRLDPGQRATALGAAEPASVQGPWVLSARRPWLDDHTYLEVSSTSASVDLRTGRDYFLFGGPQSVHDSIFTRPRAELHFRAESGMRYLLECSVDAGAPTTFFASDLRGEYTVSTADRTTLLYLRDQPGPAEDVLVSISADRTGWYLDRCELSVAAR